ncbi:hypothetical protein UlMin_037189 [Ulmus minor]
MLVSDPRAGRAFIWLIYSFLFISIAVGGGCLVMYMILPDTTTTSWLPVVGVTLVCLPWLFWLFTFFYRIFSRVIGFRIGIGNRAGSGRGGGAGGNSVVQADGAGASDLPVGFPNGRNGQFEAAVTVHEEDDGHNDRKRNVLSSCNSSNTSHESAMPLASSMAP